MTPLGQSRWQKKLLLLVALAVTVGGTLWAVMPPGTKPPQTNAAATRYAARPTVPRLVISEVGLSYIRESVIRPALKDPLSLEHIRDCYANAGYRGAQGIEQELAAGHWPLEKEVGARFLMARLYLYEGDFAKAAATLEKVRALAQQSDVTARDSLPTIIFLQGVTAMRQGETENCVDCPCESSCTFPIAPRAVHVKREGSQRAIQFFTEYLELFPDDTGVRWLLNLAYMTLGEYPDRVPPRYLIPLEPFKSEMDIGRFTDIAPRLGLNNRLNNAGGAIMEDFDNDGLLDIVVSTMDTAGPMGFYRNKGDGTFEDRAQASGLAKQLGGLNCVQADYNNDGWLDIYVMRGGWQFMPQRHSLLRNNKDGTFTDVTREAGLETPIDGQVAAWADYDNDGWLDLFVGGESTRCRLYHNRGDGTFEEIALKAGINTEGQQCKGANWGDYDGDGYPDLLVSMINGPPRLFHNNRDGTFTDVAAQLGIGEPRNGFSCWFWDYDNDGWLDLFISSYEERLTEDVRSQLGLPHRGTLCRLYRNRGSGEWPAISSSKVIGDGSASSRDSKPLDQSPLTARPSLPTIDHPGFEDVTTAVGLTCAMSPMGSNFADLDNDGFLDFYLGTGTSDYSLLVPNRLFKNLGGKRFVDITTSSGTGHLQKGHGVACGDWDRDGNVDMFVELGGATPGDRFRNALYQNPGHNNHWITVKLIGKKTNRAAIGARIKITPKPQTNSSSGVSSESSDHAPNSIYRHVTSGSSFGGNPLQQTIGIGKADAIAALEIYWPTSNTRQVFHDLAVDQAIEITEFTPTFRRLNWPRIPLR